MGLGTRASASVESDEGRPRVDLGVDHGEYLAHDAGRRGAHRSLHLHALEHDDLVACLDLVPHLNRDSDHHRRRRGTDEPGIVMDDAAAESIDVHEVVAYSGNAAHAMRAPRDHQAAFVLAQSIHVHNRRVPLDLHPVSLRTDLAHDEGVHPALVGELDLASDVMIRTGAAASRRCEERGAFEGFLRVVHIDRDAQERNVGVVRRGTGDVDRNSVKPLCVCGARDDLRTPEDLEEEGLDRGPALDEHRGLAECAPQPRQGLRTIATPRDHLRDHRVVIRGDDFSRGNPGVDPDPGAGGHPEERHRPRSRCESLRSILGVEPHLDGVASLAGGFALEPLPRGHQDLRLHQVEARGGLRDRVLHLQPGVHLHEGKGPVIRLVEVLDGSRTAVARGRDQSGGGIADARLLLLREHGRAGLLHELLMAPLDRTVSDARGPDRAMGVRDHLHLDVAPAPDEALEEHTGVTEGGQGLRLSPLEGIGQLPGGLDHADAATPATRTCLHHERVADALGRFPCVVEIHEGAAAPGGHGNAGLLGQQLGLDLVPELAHGSGGGADEGEAHPLTALCELGVFGDEAPPHPDRVGAACPQRSLEFLVVEVGA